MEKSTILIIASMVKVVLDATMGTAIVFGTKKSLGAQWLNVRVLDSR